MIRRCTFPSLRVGPAESVGAGVTVGGVFVIRRVIHIRRRLWTESTRETEGRSAFGMTDMSISPDALRADAEWIRRFADEIAGMPSPAVDLAGSEVAAAVAATPNLRELIAGLRAWADAAEAAVADLDRADRGAANALPPR
jgi:hypothetical protein